jgi:ABC-type Mn2+/Zn2+ transport system permease subunit
MAGIGAGASNPAAMRKAAGIGFLVYCGLVSSTEFDLPAGPPIVAALSVLVLFAAMTQIARRRS